MAPVRPWRKLAPAEKVEAVRPLEAAGDAASIIAWKLKAPRHEIARICSLMRREREAKGAEHPAPRMKESQANPEEAGECGGGSAPADDAGSRLDAGRTASATSERMDATVVGDESGTLPDWTATSRQERERIVADGCREGLSATLIARRFTNVSRSAVLGVIYRMRQAGASIELRGAIRVRPPGRPKGALGKKPKVARPPRPKAEKPKLPAKPFVPVQKQPLQPTSFSANGNHDDLVRKFIEQNGVRRFERGMSSDIDAIRSYVSRHGYDIGMFVRGGRHYVIRGRSGRPKTVDRDGLFRFVDEMRIADGLQPIIRREESAHGSDTRAS